MLQPSVVKFLSTLQKNNNKPWFDEHRKEYEKVKSEFLLFVDELIGAISGFDGSVASLKAKDCIFRINRDVRFSKNKSPYKNNMAAYFNRAGKKGPGAGYYIHIEPGKSFAAAGLWMPEAEDLAKIRQEIDYYYDEWKKTISAASFKKMFPGGMEAGDKLIRPPKGYSEENPAIEYLKMKSFIVSRAFTDKEIVSNGFVKEVALLFKTAKPMMDFINRSLD